MVKKKLNKLILFFVITSQRLIKFNEHAYASFKCCGVSDYRQNTWKLLSFILMGIFNNFFLLNRKNNKDRLILLLPTFIVNLRQFFENRCDSMPSNQCEEKPVQTNGVTQNLKECKKWRFKIDWHKFSDESRRCDYGKHFQYANGSGENDVCSSLPSTGAVISRIHAKPFEHLLCRGQWFHFGSMLVAIVTIQVKLSVFFYLLLSDTFKSIQLCPKIIFLKEFSFSFLIFSWIWFDELKLFFFPN